MTPKTVVPFSAILCMGIAALLSFCIPLALFLWYRKRRKADLLPFFIGMAVMFLFALVLESLVHQLVLNVLPVGQVILNNIWLYALYGGLMAGLFEETGRFIAFKTVLKRCQTRDVNALMYGAGHGGIEAAMVLGGAMISNIVIAVMLNLGLASLLTATANEATLPQLEAVFDALKTTAPASYFIGLIERVIAVPLQIALSVLVWFAAKKKRKWYLYPIAILLHFLVDGVMVVAAHYISSIWIDYAILVTVIVPVLLLTFAVWKRNRTEEPGSVTDAEKTDADPAV